MSETPWDQSVCNEKAGFLFSHKCDRFPEASCVTCAKPVCKKHKRIHNNEALCIKCYAKRPDTHVDNDNYYYQDPYFYSGYHYDSYDNNWDDEPYASISQDDPNEFTDGDAESLVEGSEEFESDMDES